MSIASIVGVPSVVGVSRIAVGVATIMAMPIGCSIIVLMSLTTSTIVGTSGGFQLLFLRSLVRGDVVLPFAFQ